jgi:Ca2+-binding EF-hand superfamily protein
MEVIMSSIGAISSGNSFSPVNHAAAMFKNADTDSDGKISKSDFKSALKTDGMSTEQADDLFSKIDADGDGTITESENSDFAKKGPAGPPPPGTYNAQGTATTAGTQSVDALA